MNEMIYELAIVLVGATLTWIGYRFCIEWLKNPQDRG